LSAYQIENSERSSIAFIEYALICETNLDGVR